MIFFRYTSKTYYEELISFIEAIRLSQDYSISDDDIEHCEKTFEHFMRWYEETFYNQKWDRLAAFFFQ